MILTINKRLPESLIRRRIMDADRSDSLAVARMLRAAKLTSARTGR